jgi:hypothetical protein
VKDFFLLESSGFIRVHPMYLWLGNFAHGKYPHPAKPETSKPVSRDAATTQRF